MGVISCIIQVPGGDGNGGDGGGVGSVDSGVSVSGGGGGGGRNVTRSDLSTAALTSKTTTAPLK